MKAYITIYKKDGTVERKNGITLEEAKRILTAKQFDKLCGFNGIHTAKIDGYIK